MGLEARPSRPGYIMVEVANPSPGKRHLLMELDAELVEKVGSFAPDGAAETELQARLERCIRDFLASQPIDFHYPDRFFRPS